MGSGPRSQAVCQRTGDEKSCCCFFFPTLGPAVRRSASVSWQTCGACSPNRDQDATGGVGGRRPAEPEPHPAPSGVRRVGGRGRPDARADASPGARRPGAHRRVRTSSSSRRQPADDTRARHLRGAWRSATAVHRGALHTAVAGRHRGPARPFPPLRAAGRRPLRRLGGAARRPGRGRCARVPARVGTACGRTRDVRTDVRDVPVRGARSEPAVAQGRGPRRAVGLGARGRRRRRARLRPPDRSALRAVRARHRDRLLGRPLRSFVPGLRAASIAAAVVAAPYVWALAVLTRRYDVGASGTLGSTGDRSVVQESLLGLTPGGGAIAVVAVALAVIGVVERPARGIPGWRSSSGSGSRSDRLLLGDPGEHALLRPLCGHRRCRRFSCWSRRARSRSGGGHGRPVLVGAAVTAALVAIGVVDDARHVERTRAVAVARLMPLTSIPQALLFSSTGSPISDRPPEHLDTYVALRRPGIERLEELPSLDPRFDATGGGAWPGGGRRVSPRTHAPPREACGSSVAPSAASRTPSAPSPTYPGVESSARLGDAPRRPLVRPAAPAKADRAIRRGSKGLVDPLAERPVGGRADRRSTAPPWRRPEP